MNIIESIQKCCLEHIFILLLCLFSTSCTQQNQQVSVCLDTPLVMPSSDGTGANIGLAGAYSGLIDNKLLILGGCNFPELPPWEDGKKFWWNDLYVYDTIQNQWKIQKNFLETGRAYGLSIQLENGFLGIGGCDEKQCYKTVFLVKLEGDSIICDTTAYPPLPLALANMSGTLLNNKIYIAGGQETVISGKSSKHFLMLDISAGKKEWTELPCWQGLSLAYSVCAAQSGKVFLFGGRSFGPDEETVMHAEGYYFDTETNEWKTLSGKFPVMAGTAMPFGKNKILLFGGVPEILPTTPSHPGFSSEILLFDTQKETLEKISNSAIPIPVTTNLVYENNYFFITSGEIKPGVRTPYILRGELVLP